MRDRAMIQPGDMYCVFCLGERLSMHLTHGDAPTWDCEDCGRTYGHPFHADEQGRFAWTWDDKHPQPNAGCPWCGSCNLTYSPPIHGLAGQWRCRRQSCRKFWRGRYELYDFRASGGMRYFRWIIHVPVDSVPWASGTWDDLECRRRDSDGLWAGRGDYFPNCCRWPKSCSAFDPGFQVGKGPTTLPIVWFDGFGWRSGPPDAKTIPRHLFDEIWLRWQEVNPRKDLRDYWTYGPGSVPSTHQEEANDDDGCGNGCEYICYHPEA